ncbi:DUF1684 domain-containing protein [Hymenobacter busanensis]|uniref:DUF1684 domain-containing protein n=1 Tax=Hymenobacter busanensis TaxID=2607656 RepID=A0A7L4ZYN0_9BACT|nr:DUF1684 domain-containing protein [Hymenobacter busanensis]KAA9331430.1 DUF1684 domain-containing protein [Hymenobacter busanensis]QHJ08584.1 DUF1684 domain-containing protein [Hymenobacter busanensis]
MNKYFLLACLLLLVTMAQAQEPARLTAAAHHQSILSYQQQLNAEFRDPAQSPLPAAAQPTFQGLPFFAPDFAYYTEARLVRDSTAVPFAMKTSTARQPLYRKFGDLYFTLQGQKLHLVAYESLDLKQQAHYEDYLFVPFTDLTNGHESYGGGRYLDLRVPKGNVLWLDFNRAYNPYCAYSSQYSCPVPPAENRLPVAIRAGVKSDH